MLHLFVQDLTGDVCLSSFEGRGRGTTCRREEGGAQPQLPEQR